LLAHFKGVDGIRHATYEELLEVPGMNSRVAESVVEYFAEKDNYAVTQAGDGNAGGNNAGNDNSGDE